MNHSSVKIDGETRFEKREEIGLMESVNNLFRVYK